MSDKSRPARSAPSVDIGQGDLRLPRTVDIRLLGACNLRCPFCFGPRHNIGPSPPGRIIGLLQDLADAGVRSLVITGGEPLLVPYLPKFLEVARGLGLTVALSTNGSLLPQRGRALLEHLDWIALPLDGPTKEIHNSLRPGRRDSFADFRRAYEMVRSEYPLIRIKVGTVVTALNHLAVASIPDAVADWCTPDTWKLYEVSLSSYGADSADTVRVSTAAFVSTRVNAQRAADEHGWSTTIYTNARRNRQYMFIEPNGDVMTVVDGRETVVANAFTDDFSVVKGRVAEVIDVDRVEQNVQATYPGLLK